MRQYYELQDKEELRRNQKWENEKPREMKARKWCCFYLLLHIIVCGLPIYFYLSNKSVTKDEDNKDD